METPPGLPYAVGSAVVGGVVYAAVSVALTGRVDFVGGAIFVLVLGFVVTVGLVYTDRRERADEREEDEEN
ncbi:hypothetical protein C474_03810 [Halogeometricum pallidum JCM 14848]|uniref:Uncharacterized protein n=1 Tax=Halogeometricum pallidum JCM 14848 TaxID=1227487 RepID=M0DGZ7_HALPD|nr:hypothetical protein [Halogeometricum pallidum]ELZ34053.1 hypothetical protein C474_03810 [Halogeometricum pallidum JCM 14848]